MKAGVDLETVVLCILELLKESRFARAGCPLKELESIMVGERGVDARGLQSALSRMQRERMVQPKDQPGPESFLMLTTKGKCVLRDLRATAQFNVRAPQRLLEELGTPPVSHEGETPSETALRLMEEGVRMEKYPGISFRWGASGRRPFVLGTGLSVWEVYHIWQDFDKNAERVAKAYPYLKAGQVNVAVAYAQAFIYEMPVGGWGEKPPFVREFKV